MKKSEAPGVANAHESVESKGVAAVAACSASGLRAATLRRYARSDLLERDDSGLPVYMHHARCMNYCDYACNGAHGDRIAADISMDEAGGPVSDETARSYPATPNDGGGATP